MTIRPPSWLSKQQRTEYTRLATVIPGFNPVLDQAALSVYISTCTLGEQLKESLKDETLPPATRLDLESSLGDAEQQKLEWANEMGLTPASSLLIARSLKKRVRRQMMGRPRKDHT